MATAEGEEALIAAFAVSKGGVVLKNIFLNAPPPETRRGGDWDGDGIEEEDPRVLFGRHPDCHVLVDHPSVTSRRRQRRITVTDLSSAINNVASQINGIEQLNGTNFPSWKDKILITLGVLDLDLALREDAPIALVPNVENYANLKKQYDEKAERWEKSNRMSLMIIKNSIFVGIKGGIPDSKNAKKYLANVEDNFKGTSKTYASTLIMRMLTSRYDGNSSVREHILSMTDMAARLKGMDMAISDGFLVHFIMSSLPPEYGPLKINYNTQKEKWSIAELISHSVEEEERKKAERLKEQAHLVSNGKRKNQGESGGFKANKKPYHPPKNDGKGKVVAHGPQAPPVLAVPPTAGNFLCKFCKKPGHVQKDCVGFRQWLAKKGIAFRDDHKKRGPKS